MDDAIENRVRQLRSRIGAAVRSDEKARRDLVEVAIEARGAVELAIKRLETDWAFARLILNAVEPISQYVSNYDELYSLMNEDTK